MQSARFERVNRFLDAPSDSRRGSCWSWPRSACLPTYLLPLWNMTMFAPQYPDGLRLDIYSYKLEGGNDGPGHEGDQRPQPLHRDEGPGGRGLHRVQVDAVRRRQPGPALPARRRARASSSHLVDVLVLYVYFGALLALVVRLQALPVRARPRPDGGGAGWRRSCRRSSATSSSRTSRSTRTRRSARTRSAGRGPRPRGRARRRLARSARRRATGRRHDGCARSRAAARLAIVALGASCCSPPRRRRRRWPPVAAGRARGPARRRRASPLQARIDAAAAGGDARGRGRAPTPAISSIDRPLRLVGRGRPRLVGLRRGAASCACAPTASRSRASTSTAGAAATSGRDSSGRPRRRAAASTVRDCRDHETRSSASTCARRTARSSRAAAIRGIPGRDPGEKGSGIHVWNTDGFRLEGNEIVEVRDGFYIQSPRTGVIRGNVARDLRYGLHYMFSDDNLFEDNLFENGAAGTALMYSRAHRLPAQPLPPQPRLRLGGAAVQGLRRRARRDQPDRRQRARHLPRGLAPHHAPRQRRRRLGRGDRALRLRRRPPLRGQLLRRQPVAARPRRHAAPTPPSTGTTGRTTASRTSTATAAATGRTAWRASSTTSAATSTAADLLPTASPRRRSARPSGTFPVLEPVPVEDALAARASARARRRCHGSRRRRRARTPAWRTAASAARSRLGLARPRRRGAAVLARDARGARR